MDLGGIVFTCSPEFQHIAQNIGEAASDCLDKKDYENAIKHLTNFMQIDDSNEFVLYDLAQAYMGIHDFKKAEDIALRYKEISEEDGWALLSAVAFVSGNLEKAFEILKQGLEKFPSSDVLKIRKKDVLKNMLKLMSKDSSNPPPVQKKKSKDWCQKGFLLKKTEPLKPTNSSTTAVPEIVDCGSSDEENCDYLTKCEQQNNIVADGNTNLKKKKKSKKRKALVDNIDRHTVLDKIDKEFEKYTNGQFSSLSKVETEETEKSNEEKHKYKEMSEDKAFLQFCQAKVKELKANKAAAGDFSVTRSGKKKKKKENQKLFKSTVKTISAEGSEAYLSGSMKVALDKFKKTESLYVEPVPGSVSDIEHMVVKYLIADILIELNIYEDIATAIHTLRQLEETHVHLFPTILVGLAKAFYKLNRCEQTLQYVERGLTLIKKNNKFEQLNYPGTKIVIKLTEFKTLQQEFNKYKQFCKTFKKPDAVCRYDKCLVIGQHIVPSVNIYHSDIDFIGYISLFCEEKCKIDFHITCWKHYKEDLDNVSKVLDKDLLNRPCVTDSCTTTNGLQSVICRIQIIGPDGKVKSTCSAERKCPRKDSVKEDPKDIKEEIKHPAKPKKINTKTKKPSALPLVLLTDKQEKLPKKKGMKILGGEPQGELLEKNLQRLRYLRTKNFGYNENEEFNPELKNYGVYMELKSDEDFGVMEADSERKSAIEFILSMYYEYLRKEGPQSVTELQAKWESEQHIFECGLDHQFFKKYKNIQNLLLNYYHFGCVGKYICTSEDVAIAHLMTAEDTKEIPLNHDLGSQDVACGYSNETASKYSLFVDLPVEDVKKDVILKTDIDGMFPLSTTKPVKTSTQPKTSKTAHSSNEKQETSSPSNLELLSFRIEEKCTDLLTPLKSSHEKDKNCPSSFSKFPTTSIHKEDKKFPSSYFKLPAPSSHEEDKNFISSYPKFPATLSHEEYKTFPSSYSKFPAPSSHEEYKTFPSSFSKFPAPSSHEEDKTFPSSNFKLPAPSSHEEDKTFPSSAADSLELLLKHETMPSTFSAKSDKCTSLAIPFTTEPSRDTVKSVTPLFSNVNDYLSQMVHNLNTVESTCILSMKTSSKAKDLNYSNEQELISQPMKTKVSRRNQFLYKMKPNVEDDIEHSRSIENENKVMKAHTKDAGSQTEEGKEAKELEALRTKVKSLKSICNANTVVEGEHKTQILQLKEEINKSKEIKNKLSGEFETFTAGASTRDTHLRDVIKKNKVMHICNIKAAVEEMYKERIHKSDEVTGALRTLLSKFTPLERNNSNYNIILEMIGRWNKYKSEVDSLYRNYMLKLLEQCTEEQTSLEMVMLPSPNFPQEPSPSILTFFLHFDNISKVADTFPNNIARNPTIRLSSTSSEENCTARKVDDNNGFCPSSSAGSLDVACSLTTTQHSKNMTNLKTLKNKTDSDKLMETLINNFPSIPEFDLKHHLEKIREENNQTFHRMPLPAIIQKMKILTSKPAWGKANKTHDQATWAGSNRNEECVICHEYMTRGVMTLECKHIFHSQCVRKWLVTDRSCPICRDYVKLDEEFPPLK